MKKYQLITAGIIAAVVLSGCQSLNSASDSQDTDQQTNTPGDQTAQLVSPAEFAELNNDPNAFLVDVHTPEQTHIPGTDAFIPFDDIQNNLAQLPEDKDTPILVYCRSGGMSRSASQEISDLGYSQVYELEGGINAYKESNVEVSLTPENQDLGTVIYGDVSTTEFTLTNFSPLPMKISRVSTSCGCTSAETEEEELDAYESTTIKVAFDPAVHKDDTDLGELTRTIYIDTDNPNYPQLTSTIAANVIKE